MKDVFVANYLYTCVYYMSLMFGTLTTITSKSNKIIAYTISLVWCLAIVRNQIDYAMKPWMEERKERRKQDMTFEKIIRFDFWTYHTVCFLGCFFPLISRKIEVTTIQTSKCLMYDSRRAITVVLLVVGNMIPAVVSYNLFSLQRKNNSTYNLLFQDFCKLGILTVDLQFAWFCWTLEDRFSMLNDHLQMIISSEITPRANTEAWMKTATSKNDYIDKISQVNVMYRKLMNSVKTVNDICEERVLMNLLCYMFNTICGLFDTISAYRTEGTPVLLVIVHLSWVVNCAGRITLVCFAASSVVEQDDRLHRLAQITKEALGAKSDHWEMKQLLRRLANGKVEFDVCGMITIDKTLLSSAVIGVISYLVIVLQYNYS